MSRATRAACVIGLGALAGSIVAVLIESLTGFASLWSALALDAAGVLAGAKVLDVAKARREARLRPPEGVVIRRADGTRIPCSVLREPALDKDGCAGWVVVPMEDWHPREDDGITVAAMPGRTVIGLPVTLPAGDPS